MKYVQTDFSKELAELLIKHNKSIESDKSGIYIVDDEIGTVDILIGKAETASEDFRDKLLFVRGSNEIINAKHK